MTAQQFDDVLKRIDEKFNAAVAEAQKDISPMLAAGVMYKIGEFSVMLAEDTNQLKVTTLHPSKHLEIRPKTDNSVEIKSCRQTTDIK